MDFLVLIDRLDDLLHNARPVPLTDQVRIDANQVYDVLDEMRAKLPDLIRDARADPAGGAGAGAGGAGVDEAALRAAVSAAIRENIPAIASATAAAVGGARPPQVPPPGGAPF